MKENILKKYLKDFFYMISGKIRQRKIKNKEFTLISNNCWGSVLYRNFHIPYQSPTCGAFFMAKDYLKFIKNMREYLKKDLVQISIEESKYSEYLNEKKYNGIIARLGDIEINFVHYDNFQECKEKWERRIKRIKWDRIVYKFNDQNLCTYQDLKEFCSLKSPNKICFTAKKYDDLDTIQLKQFENYDYVLSDTKESDYNKVFNFVRFINNI